VIFSDFFINFISSFAPHLYEIFVCNRIIPLYYCDLSVGGPSTAVSPSANLHACTERRGTESVQLVNDRMTTHTLFLFLFFFQRNRHERCLAVTESIGGYQRNQINSARIDYESLNAAEISSLLPASFFCVILLLF
jgi:hypothetical protein